MTAQPYKTFGDALEALEGAPTEDSIKAVIDLVDDQFAEGTLEVTPADWGMLASMTLRRSDELKRNQVLASQD